jgi:DNA-binding NarL/FixJ family response regulator
MDARNTAIARGLRAGASIKSIASELGISSPAVCQRIRNSPELRQLRRLSPRGVQRLRRYEQQLHRVELEARAIARNVRKAMKAISEEADAADLDRLLQVNE